MTRKTPVAADELGIAETHLHYLIRSKKVARPQRDSSGDYLWSDEDINNAREALKRDRRKERKVAAR